MALDEPAQDADIDKMLRTPIAASAGAGAAFRDFGFAFARLKFLRQPAGAVGSALEMGQAVCIGIP